MRCIKDMRIGEAGYCVSWAIDGDKIHGLYTVGERIIGIRETRVLRHGKVTFSVRHWHNKNDIYLKLNGETEPCIFSSKET